MPVPVALAVTTLLLRRLHDARYAALLDLTLVIATVLAVVGILLPTGPAVSGERLGRDDWSAGVYLGLGALGLIALGAIAALAERVSAGAQHRARGTNARAAR